MVRVVTAFLPVYCSNLPPPALFSLHPTALLVMNLTNPPATLNRCQLHQTARFSTSLPSRGRETRPHCQHARPPPPCSWRYTRRHESKGSRAPLRLGGCLFRARNGSKKATAAARLCALVDACFGRLSILCALGYRGCQAPRRERYCINNASKKATAAGRLYALGYR